MGLSELVLSRRLGSVSRPALAALVLGGVLAVLLFLTFMGRGAFNDEASFCTVGQGIVNGGLPYRDYFNEKPPLQYFLTAGTMALVGPTWTGARVTAAVAFAICAGCVLTEPFRRRASPLELSLWSALSLLAAAKLSAYTGTADASLATLYCLTALLGWGRSPGRQTALLLGALLGLAVGLRQAALFPAAVMALSPQLSGHRIRFLAGFGLGVVAWLTPFLVNGAAPAVVDATVLFHLGSEQVATYTRHTPDSKVALVIWTVLVLTAVMRQPTRSRALWVGLLLLSLVAPYLGRADAFRLWPSSAAALTLIAASGTLSGIGRLILGGLAVLLACSVVRQFPDPPAEELAVAAAVERSTAPGDRVWAGPYAPWVYCLSGRQPASRYYFIVPWTAKPEVRQALMADLRRSPPKIFVDNASLGPLPRVVPGAVSFLIENYRLAGSYGGSTIYMRR